MFDTKIMVSGNLNEYKIKALLDQHAPIDLFGVGTDLITSSDAPTINGVYKLVEIGVGHHIRPVIKTIEDKATYPFGKQVWRNNDDSGMFSGDLITKANESVDETNRCPLLYPILKEGTLVCSLIDVNKAHLYRMEELKCFPNEYKSIENAHQYPVRIVIAWCITKPSYLRRYPIPDPGGRDARARSY